MKLQIRTRLNLLIIIGLLSLGLTGCVKNNTNPDFASIIAGTYTGTITATGVGTVSASSVITKVNDTSVNLTVTINSTSVPLAGITVGHSGANIYSLTYSDSSGSLTGTVAGNTLNWTLTSGSDTDVFLGTR